MNKPCSILNTMEDRMTADEWAKDLLKRISSNVTKYRKALRLTANDLSERTGDLAGYPIPRSTIANLERGGKKTISIFELRALECAFGVDRHILERDIFSPAEINRSFPHSEPLPNYRVFRDEIVIRNYREGVDDRNPLLYLLFWLNELTETRDRLATTKLESRFSLPKFLALAEETGLSISDETCDYLNRSVGKAKASYEVQKEMMIKRSQNLQNSFSKNFPKNDIKIWDMNDHIFTAPIVPVSILHSLHQTEGVNVQEVITEFFGVSDMNSSEQTFKYSDIEELSKPYQEWCE